MDDSLERIMKLHKPPGIHHNRQNIASSTRRQGPQENCALLRRRLIESQRIYAKVDVAELRQIAWPGPEV
jgi:hypothetical protein